MTRSNVEARQWLCGHGGGGRARAAQKEVVVELRSGIAADGFRPANAECVTGSLIVLNEVEIDANQVAFVTAGDYGSAGIRQTHERHDLVRIKLGNLLNSQSFCFGGNHAVDHDLRTNAAGFDVQTLEQLLEFVLHDLR